MKTTLRSSFKYCISSGIALLFFFFLNSTYTLAHGDLHEKIQRLSAQIEADSSNIDLYLQRGQTYFQHEDFEPAIADFKKVLDLDDEIAIAQLYLAQSFAKTGNQLEALEKVNLYLSLQPYNLEGIQTRATIHSIMEMYEEAASDYALVLDLSTTYRPEIFVNAANAELLAHPANIERAISYLESGIDKMGFLITLYTYVIELASKNNRIDYALIKLDEVISQIPRKETWYYQKAELLEIKGDHHKAIDSYNLVLKSIYALPVAHRLSAQVTELEKTTEQKLNMLKNTR